MKKYLKAVLAIALALTLLSGCAKEQETAATPAPSDSSVPSHTPEASPAAATPTPVPEAEQKDGVFVIEDVETVTDGLKTIGDYIDATGAMGISWWQADDGSGDTLISLEGAGVNATVAVTPANGKIDGKTEGDSVDPSAETLALAARLTDIEWEFEGTNVSTVRGIQPGAYEEDVRAAFYDSGDETAIYSASDVLPGVELPTDVFVGAKKVTDDDENYLLYSWRAVEPSELGFEHADLFYYLEGGLVESIALHVYYGD